MTAETPGQALYAQLQRRYLESAPVPPAAWTQAWDDLDAMDERFLEDAAQAVIDAATEGSLRACGYTLADVGRFLEAEAAAQGARPAPGYVTINARDIAIALNGYAGFTGDPVSFASELHERLRRTVFADEPHQPKPAAELLDKARAELDEFRVYTAKLNDGITELARDLGASCATRTPAQGHVEHETANALRKLLDPS